ncbi:hypothetical protein [Paenibacillus sp. SYP-B3998]|nr:hypothetical protein [Paenibacillus sp. SYP-B3998]
MYYDEDRVPFDQLDEIIIREDEQASATKTDKLHGKQEATV